MAETTAKKQRPPHMFKPGQSGNPKGRPKGAKQRLGEAFVLALAADFDENGIAAITKVREERPQDYLKVVASILPKELNIYTDPLEELSDDELTRRIRQLAVALSIEIGIGEGDGINGEAPEPESTGDVSSIH